MASADSLPRALRVPKRKASTYADGLFDAQKKELARNLLSLRLRQGLSQEALAYEAEVERSYVSLIERGQGNPSLRVLCQLAQRLGVTVVEMMAGPGSMYALPAVGSGVYVIQDREATQSQVQVSVSRQSADKNS